MLCLVTGLRCDPGGQTTKLDRMDRSLGGSRVGKRKKKRKKEWQTVAVFKTGGGRGVYGGISSSNSSSLRPVNQKDLQPHLAVVTRGAATETNSCQRTTSDLSTATV